MDSDEKSSQSSTLARGLRVLELVSLQGEGRGVTLQEITRAMLIPRSNAYRYVATLCEEGWLKRDGNTFRYQLGWKTLKVAGAALQDLELRNIARPFLRQLAEQSQLTVHLAILTGDSILYIDKVESDSPIQMRSRLGMTAPCYCTAMGKAMLAAMEPCRVRGLLQDPLVARTANTIADLDAMQSHLDSIRHSGFAIDNEENEPGIGCIGAAIFNYEDQVIGGVSVSALIQLLDETTIQQLSERVRQVARSISQSMGCPNEYWFLENSKEIQLGREALEVMKEVN